MNKLPAKLFDRMKPEFAAELGIKPSFNTATPLLIVTGKNAVGKSLLRRWLQMVLRDEKIECMHLSQQDRADSYGMTRLFIYGSETDESTGAMTAKTFLSGMHTSRNRDIAHVLLWDEPEIGMGEELQLGTANWLCDQLADWPKNLRGVILLTHSRHFVRRAAMFPGVKWLSMDGIPTSEAWLAREIVPANPEELSKSAREKWSRMSKILKP